MKLILSRVRQLYSRVNPDIGSVTSEVNNIELNVTSRLMTSL